MGYNWKSKTQFRRLSDDLSALEKKDFERGVLPYLRMVYGNAVEALALGSIDRCGVDIVVPSDRDGKFSLGVQCKGFHVADIEINGSQITQCLGSIQSFSESELQLDEYWIVHNRTSNSRAFYCSIEPALKTLIQRGRLKAAHIYDRDEFLSVIFDGVFGRFKQYVASTSMRFREKFGPSLGLAETPIENVPYERREVRVSQYRFDDSGPATFLTQDPALEFRDTQARLSLLLGEFGMGKSTLALRLASRMKGTIHYVPAATFPDAVSGTKEFFKHLFALEAFFEDFATEAQRLLERMILLIAEKLLSENDSQHVLVIDGLDESRLLNSSSGFATMFDALSQIRAKAILTMRTEFWKVRLESFLSGYSGRSAPQKRSERNRQLLLIELAPWDKEQIINLINEVLMNNEARNPERIQDLKRLVENDSYEALYGNIPRRPLYLGMLIDFVDENGLQRMSLVELFQQWVKSKIRRDIANPILVGGSGRIGICQRNESPDTTLRVSLQAMRTAATLTAEVTGDSLELAVFCNFETLAKEVHGLENVADPTGLVLNSLLVPGEADSPLCARPLRFTHRSFQEFFLAQVIVEEGKFPGLIYPVQVQEWIRQLKQ